MKRSFTMATLAAAVMSGLGAAQVAQAEVVCRDVPVTHQAQPQDQHRILGTVAGAALGGLVGNQFGGGNTNKALTAAGVVAGGYAGNKVQERTQQGSTYTTMERRCEEVR